MNSNLIKLIFVVLFVMLFLKDYNSSLKLNLESKYSMPKNSIQIENTSIEINTPIPNQITNEKTKNYLNLYKSQKLFKKKLEYFISTYEISSDLLNLTMPLENIFSILHTFAKDFFLTGYEHEFRNIEFESKIESIKNKFDQSSSGFFAKQRYILTILKLIEEWEKLHNFSKEELKDIIKLFSFV